jgi:hypothetical protein
VSRNIDADVKHAEEQEPSDESSDDAGDDVTQEPEPVAQRGVLISGN